MSPEADRKAANNGDNLGCIIKLFQREKNPSKLTNHIFHTSITGNATRKGYSLIMHFQYSLEHSFRSMLLQEATVWKLLKAANSECKSVLLLVVHALGQPLEGARGPRRGKGSSG